MPQTHSYEINELILTWGIRDEEALRALTPLIYFEFPEAARKQLPRIPAPISLRSTAQVVETCLETEYGQLRCHHVKFRRIGQLVVACAPEEGQE